MADLQEIQPATRPVCEKLLEICCILHKTVNECTRTSCNWLLFSVADPWLSDRAHRLEGLRSLERGGPGCLPKNDSD